MIKPIVEDLDLIRGQNIELERIEIVTDDHYSDRIEIYMLDEQGNRIEGGTFSRSKFMDLIKEFYNNEY